MPLYSASFIDNGRIRAHEVNYETPLGILKAKTMKDAKSKVADFLKEAGFTPTIWSNAPMVTVDGIDGRLSILPVGVFGSPWTAYRLRKIKKKKIKSTSRA